MPISAARTRQAISVGSFQVAYNDANWDWRTFDLERDLPLVDEKVGAIVNAVNPDLSKFKARGGKLLMYHGWNDTAISPGNAIDYYTQRAEEDGRQAGRLHPAVHGAGDESLRRRAGSESGELDGRARALARVRHRARSDRRRRLGNNRIEVSRPLCAYPQVAVYNGKGTTNDAGNFSCKNP